MNHTPNRTESMAAALELVAGARLSRLLVAELTERLRSAPPDNNDAAGDAEICRALFDALDYALERVIRDNEAAR